ncbi:MAG: hypothetical protein K0S71_807 [Clostridia bacterium]|jgi:hypothetical protein|nr:hypothetical protein [Clostridia bacterium]
MSFIFNYNNNFSLVDNNSKYGVFCQFYNHTGLSRPVQIQSSNSLEYSGAMDESGNLHVVTMPTRYQISYFSYDNNHYTKKTLVENSTETYTFSNPMIHCISNEVHIFYLSNKVGSNAYTMVHQSLSTSSVDTLLDTNYTLQNIKSFSYKDTIYIFYIIQNNHSLLKCLKITSGITEEITLLSSKIPICDYTVCISEDHLDIAYVAELHGKYQLVYYNTQTNASIILCHTLVPSNPVIFWSYNYLWINYVDNNKLNILLSIDRGYSFSSPVLSSIQNPIRRCSFRTNKDCSLKCTELYASTIGSIRLCTLFSIDFEHIHSDSKIPLELELLFEGLSLTQRASSHTDELTQENVQLKEQIKILKLKYEQTPSGSPAAPEENSAVSSSIKSAANAFMEELPLWDAPPRL